MSDKPVQKNPDCPCANKDCPRNGICEKCKEFHHSNGSKTTCERQGG